MNKKKKQITFEDVYTFPFTRRYSKVFTKDSNSAFDFAMKLLFPLAVNINDDTKDLVVAKLNGTNTIQFTIPGLEYDPTSGLIYQDGLEFILIRGWGYLTGSSSYACGLEPEKAKEIQDNFAKFIIEKLSN